VTSLISPTEIQLVIDEVYRVLKPGGRIALSDLLLRRELDEEAKGAVPSRESGLRNGVLVNQFESALRAAGFEGKFLNRGSLPPDPMKMHGN